MTRTPWIRTTLSALLLCIAGPLACEIDNEDQGADSGTTVEIMTTTMASTMSTTEMSNDTTGGSASSTGSPGSSSTGSPESTGPDPSTSSGSGGGPTCAHCSEVAAGTAVVEDLCGTDPFNGICSQDTPCQLHRLLRNCWCEQCMGECGDACSSTEMGNPCEGCQETASAGPCADLLAACVADTP